MGHIFLSYSRADTDLMQRIRDDLRAQGLEVWTDEAMQPGEPSWQDAIQNAIDDAGCMVVVLSPSAKQSRWVKEEMRYAEAQDVQIFPILAQGSAKRSVPFGFLTAQWVDVRRQEDYLPTLKKLAGTIRFHLGLESFDQEHPPRKDTPPPETTEQPAAPTEQRRIFPTNVSKAIMILQNRENKWWRRVDAINHLGELGDPRVRPVLQAYLEDADVDVQIAAQQALESIPVDKPVQTQTADAVEDDADTQDPRVAARRFDTLPTLDRTQLDATTVVAPPGPLRTLKLMVTGPDADLREAFIRAISEVDVLSRRRDATMTFGQISVSEDVVVYLFATPSDDRFIATWEVLTEGMLGAVVVLDSTAPNLFYLTRDALLHIEGEYPGLPVVVAAANPDHPTAWQTDFIRRALRAENTAIVPCDVNEPDAVKAALLELIYQLPMDVE